MFKADLSTGDQITTLIVCLLGRLCKYLLCSNLLKNKSLVYDTPGTVLSARSSSLILAVSVLGRPKKTSQKAAKMVWMLQFLELGRKGS